MHLTDLELIDGILGGVCSMQLLHQSGTQILKHIEEHFNQNPNPPDNESLNIYNVTQSKQLFSVMDLSHFLTSVICRMLLTKTATVKQRFYCNLHIQQNGHFMGRPPPWHCQKIKYLVPLIASSSNPS